MVSFIKRLFSSPDVVGKAMDAVIDTGDALIFTKEEQSKANMMRYELKLRAAEATTGSRLARRLLSLMFCGTYLLGVIICFVLIIMAAFSCAPVDGVVGYCAPDVAQAGMQSLLLSAALGGSVIAIVSWYFWSDIKRVQDR